MSDTQWPRFIVFHQPKPGAPHEYAGSVHAPDAELALLNARDVFVRRPACASLWVVLAEVIASRTAQEIASGAEMPDDGERAPETYHVFHKLTQKGTFVHQGEVLAASPSEAIRQALDSLDKRPLAIWVFSERVVTRSSADDIEPMFAPAISKDFRDQTEFHTVAMMQQLKSLHRVEDDES
jgi:ring-1,2-phenylacetyl-CoA epoxidase subunit PaaB